MRWIFAGALVLVSAWAQDDETVCAKGNLLREWRGDKTGVSSEGYYVVRDVDTWKNLWKQHQDSIAPSVDFEREMVLAAFPREAVEISWMRVTQVNRPGRSKLWVGLCPATRALAFHIAVVGRSDLPVEFWFKDEALKVEPGKEPARGGRAVDARLVHGVEGVWLQRLAKLSADEQTEAAKYVEGLASDDVREREQAERGLVRLGARARGLLEPLAAAQDVDLRTRAKKLLEQITTFEPRGKVLTREHALWTAREHLALKYPDQFSNDPEMRWEDDGARPGPDHWEVTLKYL